MAEYNPRQLTKDQYAQLKDSLTRFGLVDPLIINKNKQRKNILVGGHQRLRVATDLGIKKIPCVEVDLSLDKEKELNIRLNKNVGEWDYDSLANYFDVGELTEWGFSNDELQFYEDEPEQGLIDDDEIPEVEEAVTKLGDLWLLGEHRVLCGDATKKEDVERLMDNQKADMVFTDPPWNVNYGENLANGKYKDRKIINDNMSTEDFKFFINKSFISLKNSSKEGCMTYIVMSAQEWGNLMLSLKENDYHWSSTIIWNKSSLIISRKDYHTKYEPIWYGWLNGESRLKPLKDRKQSDVWDIKKPSSSKLHPTTKPIELIEKAILNSSLNKNIIIDLFLGSGSTLIASEKTNRKCYGMELDPHYCDVIVKRWEEFTGKKAERVKRVES
jgi:DNA modification methylase